MHRVHLLVRSWLLATAATSLGSVAHVLGGGNLPHPLLLALATSLAALLTLGLSIFKLRATSLAASVATGQGLLHLLYTHQDLTLALHPAHHHLGGAHSQPVLLLAAPQHHSPLMLAGHTLAALATYGLLRRGENLLYFLLDLLGASLHRLTRSSQAPNYRAPQPPRGNYLPLPTPLSLLHGASRITRGPPALLAP